MMTTLIGVVSVLLTIAAGFGWMVHRMDALENRLVARIDGGDEKLVARVEKGDEKLGARIDGLEERLSVEIAEVRNDLNEVKVAVARLEGPSRPPLMMSH